jgi:hypothetical protein
MNIAKNSKVTNKQKTCRLIDYYYCGHYYCSVYAG